MKNVIQPKMNGSNGILSRIAEKCWWKAAAAWLGWAHVGNQSAAEHAAVLQCCNAAVLQYPARAPRTLASRRSCGGPALGEQWPIHRPQICEHPYKPLIFLYRSSSSHFVSKVATAKCVKQVTNFKLMSLRSINSKYFIQLCYLVPERSERRHKSCKLNIIINHKWTSRVSRGAGAGPGLFQELHSFV